MPTKVTQRENRPHDGEHDECFCRLARAVTADGNHVPIETENDQIPYRLIQSSVLVLSHRTCCAQAHVEPEESLTRVTMMAAMAIVRAETILTDLAHYDISKAKNAMCNGAITNDARDQCNQQAVLSAMYDKIRYATTKQRREWRGWRRNPASKGQQAKAIWRATLTVQWGCSLESLFR